MKKTGFTLAELLLTIAVIGVVVAIIVPATINDIRNKDLEAKYKTLRSILLQAHITIRNENGGSVNGVNYAEEMAKKLNVVKNCNIKSELNGCWHPDNTVKFIKSDGSYTYSNKPTSGGLILQNGMMLRLLKSDEDIKQINCHARDKSNTAENPCYVTYHIQEGFCAEFYADLNGREPPNIYGQDVRFIQVWDDRIAMLGDTQGQRRTVEKNPSRPASDYEEGGECYDDNEYGGIQY